MKNDQANAMLSLRTVDAFLDTHADKLPGVAQSGARRRLTDTLEAARDHTTDQARSNIEAQGLTRKHRALRTTLVRDHMRPIARVARADLSTIPDFQALRLPPSGVTPSKLFAAAMGMGQVAQSNAQPFLDAGMPADFTAQLVSAAEAMMQALDTRRSLYGERHGATMGLRQTIAEGRNAVRILDAFVTTELQDDPALLANWKTIARVRASRTTRTPAAPSADTTPAASPGGATLIAA